MKITIGDNDESGTEKKIIADGGKDPDYNFDIQEELEPKEFIKKASQYNNHIHVFPTYPERRLTAYLHTGDAGSGEVIKTEVNDVTYSMNYDAREREVENWFLTGDQADNFLAFLNCLKWERTDTRVVVTWYEESGKGMFEGAEFGEESLQFKYRTESGNIERVTCNNVYRRSSKSVHLMANFQ
jgi:hypothetical protein